MAPFSAYAETGDPGDEVGDPNIDGGGAGLGKGLTQSYWYGGDEGVRVTVVRASDRAVVTTPIDLTNKTPSSGLFHFGKVCKIQYNGGTGLTAVRGGYSCSTVERRLPKIIATKSGGGDIDEIKRYFCSEYVLMRIADKTGMNYEVLIGGEYKILLEPIAYFKFEGVDVAMTATEAAMYDESVSGRLRSQMVSLSHKNLPLAMFLEFPDMGYPAWSGSQTAAASNADIKSSLGLGIVRFNDIPEELVLEAYDYEYRVNTEVITSVMVSGGQSSPDRPARVTFRINGVAYNVGNIYYPSGDSQLAWVRWTTPPTPQDMVITVSVSGPGSAQGVINVNITDLGQNEPPNPVADDRNDLFVHASVPNRTQSASASWGVWRPWWNEYWVWHSDIDDEGVDNGYWCDHGWWEFSFDRYSANLSAAMSIAPDTHSPTASGRVMKSGYGINQVVTSNVTSTQITAVTATQNAVSYFPEFRYEEYWRLLERTSGGYSARFEFRRNDYSTYKNRTHFTPVWMPDGPYTVNTWLIDSWTPVGMLSMNLTDSLTIRGSLWDDWHVAPTNPQ